MEIFKLEKPAIEKLNYMEIFAETLVNEENAASNLVKSAAEPAYLYWDKFKYIKNSIGLSPEKAWFIVKIMRGTTSKETVIRAEDGNYFVLNLLPQKDELLHTIDMGTGGTMFASYDTLSPQQQHKFISRGIIEEAIASSQIEGANTTRKAAKKMILEKRKPRNRSEQMILNNYIAMQQIEQKYKHEKMSLDMLLSLHSVLTVDDSGMKEDEKGRFRTDKDDIVVQNQSRMQIVHVPPKEEFLKAELLRFVDFANDTAPSSFVHPVIKAILLHFWIGYLHPFTDGNGRIARAVFYWYLFKKNYWTMMFLPISTAIKKSRAQYDMAYIYSEQDDKDVTYFVDYHLKKIIQALHDFNDYVQKKTKENRQINTIVSRRYSLNERQKQVLHFLLSEGNNATTTADIHMSIFNISRLTAYKDLKSLEKLGFLASQKVGRNRQYFLTEKIYKDSGDTGN